MSIKEKLKNNEQVFGTWCIIPSPEVVNIMAKAGLDFVIVDFEHSPVDFITAQKMIMAAKAEGKDAVVRVGRLEETEILRVLDIGPDGIIIPHIASVEDAQKALNYIKYPPKGVRGYSPYTRSGGYSVQPNYTSNENDRVAVGIIVEGEDGIKNLPEIVKIEDIDIVYLGAYDISSILGLPGQINHPKVKELLEKCIADCQKANKTVGCLFHTEEDYKYFTNLNVNFLVYKVDSAVLYNGFEFIRKIKEV